VEWFWFFDCWRGKPTLMDDGDLAGAGVVRGVYFIQAGEGGPVKIGWSDDVGKRLRDLQGAHYEELRLLCVYGGLGRQGHTRLEKVFHRVYAPARIRGEWFRPGWGLIKTAERPTKGTLRMFGFYLTDGDFIDNRLPTKEQVEQHERKMAEQALALARAGGKP
jgi:hypothetical protein